MLLKIYKYLRGFVKMKVEGYSPERFLNLCNVHHIFLWGVEHRENCCEMYLSIKDFKKIRPLVRKTRTKVILLEKHGLPFFLFRFRKRKVFFCGMIFCAACIYALSFFVWNIHFEGNRTQSVEELMVCLETLEITHGTLKSNILCEDIEKTLRNTYPNILWVSAELRGTKLIIQMKENEDQDIVTTIEEKDDIPVSIIANSSGTITSIIVRSGTPLVKVGDEVTCGQTLVEGFYAIKNDSGETVRYEGVPADADIYLMKEETYVDEISLQYDKKNYTGKKILGIRLQILEKIFDLTPKIRYPTWEAVKKEKQIRITENFYLPFSFEYTWYLEYSTEKKFYTKEEINHLAQKRFYEKYKNILQKGVQIIEKDVKIEPNGKLCHVVGRVKLLVPETTKVPTVIPETATKASLEGEYEI